jgi:hypothetical protein
MTHFSVDGVSNSRATRTLGTRPVVLVVRRDERSLMGCAKVADKALTGRVGVMGAPADQWYHAEREQLFFAGQTDIHSGRLTARALPSLPPNLREELSGDRELALQPVSLLPETGHTARGRQVTASPGCGADQGRCSQPRESVTRDSARTGP